MKTLVILVLLAGVGYGAYKLTIGRPAEKRACAHLVDLCGDDHSDKDVADCEQTFADLRKIGGDDSVDKPAQCLADAKTCGEGVGCVAGAMGRAGINFGSDFFKGLDHSLSK
jgi:hypothetical protein